MISKRSFSVAPVLMHSMVTAGVPNRKVGTRTSANHRRRGVSSEVIGGRRVWPSAVIGGRGVWSSEVIGGWRVWSSGVSRASMFEVRGLNFASPLLQF